MPVRCWALQADPEMGIWWGRSRRSFNFLGGWSTQVPAHGAGLPVAGPVTVPHEEHRWVMPTTWEGAAEDGAGSG